MFLQKFLYVLVAKSLLGIEAIRFWETLRQGIGMNGRTPRVSCESLVSDWLLGLRVYLLFEEICNIKHLGQWVVLWSSSVEGTLNSGRPTKVKLNISNIRQISFSHSFSTSLWWWVLLQDKNKSFPLILSMKHPSL